MRKLRNKTELFQINGVPMLAPDADVSVSYEDLDAALLMGMDMTIEEMSQRGVPIHKNTLAARDWLLAHKS